MVLLKQRKTSNKGEGRADFKKSLYVLVTNPTAWNDLKGRAGLVKWLLHSTGIYEIEFQWHIEQFIESVPKVRIL